MITSFWTRGLLFIHPLCDKEVWIFLILFFENLSDFFHFFFFLSFRSPTLHTYHFLFPFVVLARTCRPHNFSCFGRDVDEIPLRRYISNCFLLSLLLSSLPHLGCQPTSIFDLVAPSSYCINSQFLPIFLQSTAYDRPRLPTDLPHKFK